MSEADDNQPVLSEEEIEALVDHAVTDNVFDDGQFKSHDFGAGEALTLSKWSELDGLLRAHAEVLQGVLLRNFGQEATIEPFAPLFARVGDLIPAISERVAFITTEIKPLEGESHLEVPGDFLSFLVNQYFGGGTVASPKLAGKVTPSEQRLSEQLAKDVLRTLVEVWSDRLVLEPGDLYVDITTDRLSLLPADMGYVVLTYSVACGSDYQGEFRLLLPYESMALQAPRLMPARREEPEVVVEPEWEARLQSAVPEIDVELCGVVSLLETSLRNLLAFKVGTVIPINEPQTAQLMVEGRGIARGKYGAHDSSRAVQITDFSRSK